MTKRSPSSLKPFKAKPLSQPFECKYCKSKYHREESLTRHMCPKKMRHLEINSVESRLAIAAFQRFYSLTMSTRRPRTVQEFIDSPYYVDFIKFGNHLANLRPLYQEQFIDFVIKNSVKLKDWTADFVYESYIEDLVKREPATTAVSRSIEEVMKWSTANKHVFSEFFRQISPNEAAYMIKTGKLSPWILYLAENGAEILSKFNEDHKKMIGAIIDPTFWMRKFRAESAEVDYIKDLLGQAGL